MELLKTLIDAGYEAYIIGGYVRDKLLGIPAYDADIVTSAKPDEIISVFKDRKCELVGKSFGVVIVDGTEIATYRKDRYFGGSNKNVKVTYSQTLKEDTSRRDLTINTLAMDIDGNIIDYNNGIKDLENRIIKFVGKPEDRVKEDPNRMIRACRFLALIDGMFHPETFSAIQKYSDYAETLIKKERIRKEIMKAMNIRKASKFFIALHQTNILKYIFPSLEECIGVMQDGYYHREPIFSHNMMCGDAISCRFPLIKLSGYLHDVGKPIAKEYDVEKEKFTFHEHEDLGASKVKEEITDLKFSNYEIDFVYYMIKSHMYALPSTAKGFRKLIRNLDGRGLTYRDFMRLRLADRYARVSEAKKYPNFREIIDIMYRFENVFIRKEPFGLKDLAINGYDLMNLGIPEGPQIGNLLRCLLDMVIENPEFNNRESLIHLAKSSNATQLLPSIKIERREK